MADRITYENNLFSLIPRLYYQSVTLNNYSETYLRGFIAFEKSPTDVDVHNDRGESRRLAQRRWSLGCSLSVPAGDKGLANLDHQLNRAGHRARKVNILPNNGIIATPFPLRAGEIARL